MSKFRKVAKVALPTGSFSDLLNLLQSGDDQDGADLLSLSNIKQNLQYLAALFPGWSDRYSPSAFYHALETDKPRGYNDTKHSQGAYETMSPELIKAIEEFKKNPPKDLKDLDGKTPLTKIENQFVPESSGRYKAMQEKLYPSATPASTSVAPSTSTAPSSSPARTSSEVRFVKTSQQSTRKDQLQKVMPKWTIQNVLRDMARVASRRDLSNAEKQQSMATILSQYEKEIAPLNQYLKQNGIQYK